LHKKCERDHYNKIASDSSFCNLDPVTVHIGAPENLVPNGRFEVGIADGIGASGYLSLAVGLIPIGAL